MKFKFKKQDYQTKAVQAVVDCFAGQKFSSGQQYRVDPGRAETKGGQIIADVDIAGFRNKDITLNASKILENIQGVQHRQNLPMTNAIIVDPISPINLDIEMETGTGKTYCYINTFFELNRHYGWSKFIVVVPSIAIREGVFKSLQITADHFLEGYGKKARFFIYSSKSPHDLEGFSSDAGINVMIINIQAFNAKGKDNRRIYEELDDFQTRRPIDVIKANHPILILDEPQKMEGVQTLDSLKDFNPLMVLRYSATLGKKKFNKIHRLDALDAYNQKLVKKIAVRGITVKGLPGTSAYLYLESIEVSSKKPPVAKVELEIKQRKGLNRIQRKLGKKDNLFVVSGGLEQYKGFVVSDINAHTDTVSFTNGKVLHAGSVSGDKSEANLRRIQIREAIHAHFDKEAVLYRQGIKVLSLFFIDEVAKYRKYGKDGEEIQGDYARIFEEEYVNRLNEIPKLSDDPYIKYLQSIEPDKTHQGYFSIDKKTKRLVNPETARRSTEADDVDAYDLILKDKERLLSLNEPVRFIFSHSALREGWDNPNVFVICTLKHSDNTITKRQEVGRGMRLAVNQNGDRMDDPATVHQINVLTVVASESYEKFVTDLQSEISESLSERPRKANEAYFTGKLLKSPEGEKTVTPHMAKQIYRYLAKNDYTDDDDKIAQKYHDAKRDGTLASLPPELAPFAAQVFALVDSVFSDAQLPTIDNERKVKTNPLNANFEKKEFKELWKRINRKAAYTVHFETPELVEKCVATLDKELKVSPLQYTVQRGEQIEEATYEALKVGEAFLLKENETAYNRDSAHSSVKYDLVGKLAEATLLTRRTVVQVLQGVNLKTFGLYKTNPEDFLRETSRLMNEQKATVIIEHLTYSPIDESYGLDIFMQEKPKDNFNKAVPTPQRNIYDYVFTDSKTESDFVKELDASIEVVVYSKLPRGFFIPTPVGDYNPDWAIAFQEGNVKHVYFVAETKGSMSTMELRGIEIAKINCARKFFVKITSEQVKYDVVNSFGELMKIVTVLETGQWLEGAILPDYDSIPSGTWANIHSSPDHDAELALTSLLRAINAPIPINQFRMAALYVLNPSLLTPRLSPEKASLWKRLVGSEATSNALQVPVQTCGNAISRLRSIGRLVEDQENQTWGSGQTSDAIITPAWSDGRTQMTVDFLNLHNTEELTRQLAESEQRWVLHGATN